MKSWDIDREKYPGQVMKPAPVDDGCRYWREDVEKEIAARDAEIKRLRPALLPILAHADNPDTAPPLRISVRQAREMKEKVNA